MNFKFDPVGDFDRQYFSNKLVPNTWIQSKERRKLIETLSKKITSYKYEVENDRSTLSKVFDFLSIPLYTTAGFVKGLTDGADKDSVNPFEGAWRGFKSGFTGDEKGRYTYSKVMQGVGWQPTSMGGKVAQGVLGFGLDVLLDPLTYLSGGTSALVRGTGRAGVAMTHTKPFVKSVVEEYGLHHLDDLDNIDADKLADEVYQKVFNEFSGRGLSVAKDIAKSKADDVYRTFDAFDNGLDIDRAKEIIKARMVNRGVTLTDDEILSDAEKFVSKFNKTIGLRETPEYGLNLSLKNLPFIGEKYFPNAKRLEFTTPKGTQDFGEATVAPYYAKLRNAIYGTQFAKKFSTVTPLYLASKEDPGIVYDFVKMVDITQGLTGDKLAKEKIIRDWAEKNLKGITPAESKKLIDILEDKTMWSELKGTIKLLDTKEAKIMRNELVRQRDNFKKEIDDLTEMQEFLNNSKYGVDNDLVKSNETIDALREEYHNRLRNLNFDEPIGLENLQKLVKIYEVEKDEINKGMIDNIKKFHNDYRVAIESKGKTKLQNVVNEDGNISYNISVNKYVRGVGYVKRTPEEIAQEVEKIKRRLGKSVSTNKGEFEAKVNLSDAISEYVYGIKGMIHRNLFASKYDELIAMIDKGMTPEQIRDYLSNDLSFVNRQEMYSFIASKIGYGGKNSEFKTWDDFYTKRLKEIYDKYGVGTNKDILSLDEIIAGKTSARSSDDFYSRLSEEDARVLAEITAADYERRSYLAMFGKMKSYDEVLEYINQEKYHATTPGLHAEELAQIEDLKRRQDAFEQSGSILRGRVNEIDIKIADMKKEIESLKIDGVQKTTRNLVERPLTKKDIKELEGQIKEIEKQLEGIVDTKIAQALNNSLKKKREALAKGTKQVNRVVKADSKKKRISDLTTRIETLEARKRDLLKDKVYNETPVRGFLPHERSGELENILKQSKYKNSKTQIWAESIIKDMEIFLEELGRNWSDISVPQRKAIRKLARWNVSRVNKKPKALPRISWREVDEVTATSDEMVEIFKGWDEFHNIKSSSVEPQFTQQTVRLHDLINKIDDLHLQIKDYKSKLSNINEVDNIRKLKIEELQKEATERLEGVFKHVEDLRLAKRELINKIDDSNVDIYDVGRQIERLEKILNNDDVFETYVRANLSAEEIEGAINFVDVTKIMLDADMTVDDKIKAIAKDLRDKFTEIGASEVEAGVLKQEQVDKWINGYVTRLLTEDGAEFLGIKEFDDDVQAALTQGYGYGKIRNQFAHSRVKEFDGYTINQINKEMSKKLGGKNLFSDSIFDIYQTRALQNLEVLYDTHYTQEMMNIFGTEVKRDTVIKDGFGSVISLPKIKDSAVDMAKLNISLDMSNEISHVVRVFLRDNSVDLNRTIEQNLNAMGITSGKEYFIEYNRQFNQAISEHIDAMVAIQFDEVSMKNLFERNFNEYLEKSTLGVNSIDSMSTPMFELSKDNINGIFNYYDSAINIFQHKIRNNIFKFERGRLEAKIKYFENLQNRQKLTKKQVNYLYDVLYDEYALKYVDELDGKGNTVPNSSKRLLELHDLSMAEVRETINRLKGNAYDFEVKRLDSLIGAIEKIDKLEPPQIREVHQSLINKANQTRKLQMLKDHNRLVQIYDKFLHFVKLNQTVVMPSFHMRNKFSNMFNNWLGIGQDALNVKNQIDALKVVRSKGQSDKVIEGLNSTWGEIYNLALAHGVIDTGYFAKDFGAHTKVQGKLRRWVKAKYDPTDTKNFFAYKVGTEVGGTVENSDKLIHFMSRLKAGDKPWQAAESVEKYLFDYSNLTDFEQNVMKRIFPYYTWLKKNGALQVESLLEKPFKYAMVAKVTHAIENSNDEKTKMDSQYVDRFAQDWIQLPFTVKNPRGITERVMLNPNLPYMDLSRIPRVTSPIKSIEDLVSQTALPIKAAIELPLNRNTKFEQPIFKEDEGLASTGGTLANYLLSNFAEYNVGKDMVQKEDLDFGLQMLNNMSGVKLLSYDYETYKSMKMKNKIANNYLTSEEMDNKFKKFFTDMGGSLVSGFKGQVSRAVDDVLADRPDAFKYEGAMRPISKKTYEGLSEEERKAYIPPTLDEAIVYNKMAKSLEDMQYKESGVMKRFSWFLADKLDFGDKPTIGKVTKVIDGDTFEVDINGEKKKVRLLLVDTPESVGKDKLRDYEEKPMPYGKEASTYSKKALFGKDVKLIFDGPKEDATDSKRMLAYVSVDGEDYNEKLLKEGLAQVRYLFEPYYKNKSKYYQTEGEAYNQKKGIWSKEGYVIPGDDTGYNELKGW